MVSLAPAGQVQGSVLNCGCFSTSWKLPLQECIKVTSGDKWGQENVKIKSLTTFKRSYLKIQLNILGNALTNCLAESLAKKISPSFLYTDIKL